MFGRHMMRVTLIRIGDSLVASAGFGVVLALSFSTLGCNSANRMVGMSNSTELGLSSQGPAISGNPADAPLPNQQISVTDPTSTGTPTPAPTQTPIPTPSPSPSSTAQAGISAEIMGELGGFCLGTASSPPAAGGSVETASCPSPIAAAETFTFVQVGTASYLVESASSGLCLQYGSSGTVVSLEPCMSIATQTWITSLNADGSYSLLTNTGPNPGCLMVIGSPLATGVNVGASTCDGDLEQEFEIDILN